MYEDNIIPPEALEDHWIRFTQDKAGFRYLPKEQQYSEGSFTMIENAPYPLLGLLRREDLIKMVTNLMAEFREFMVKFRELTADREYLGKKIDALESRIEKLTPTPEVIVIEEIPESEARDRILKLLDEIGDDIIYPDEISHKLRIDFDMVMKILKDLKTEGTIEVVK